MVVVSLATDRDSIITCQRLDRSGTQQTRYFARIYYKQLSNVTENLGPPIVDMVESALGNWVQPWWVRH